MDFRSGLRSLPLSATLGLCLTVAAAAAPAVPAESRFVQDEAVDGLNHHDPAAGGIVVTKAAALHGSVRKLRGVKWQRAATVYGPGDTWADFVRSSGSQWQSAWDRATNTPLRVWGEGMAAPGSMASEAVAESFARGVLAAHLALWAPGATPADFRLVSNHSDGDQRSVGFVQTYQGMDVLGAQVSFRFKNDRLFVIASEAIPHITLSAPPRRALLSAPRLRQQVASQLSGLGLPAAAQIHALAEARPVILPFVGDDAVLGLRVVVPHEVASAGEGRWTLYADPTTGEAVAFETQSFYATGRVLYNLSLIHI